jgi:hypothetical protein
VFEAAARECKSVEARRRRVHSWFDAFRTLKFVHAVRDRCFPNVPWREALRDAPFFWSAVVETDDFSATRTAFADAELALPRYAGPTV